MMDLQERYGKCDWCGDSIKNIGPAVVGFMFQVYNVYLCNNPKCAHEMDLVPDKLDHDSYEGP
jgi:hypothetical protein